MELSAFQKRIIFIISIFILVRIPIMLIIEKVSLYANFAQDIEFGLIMYCDVENFIVRDYLMEHSLPPGALIYGLVLHYFFNNIAILVFEFINMVLIYFIISKFYGKISALNALILITFFPISILNTGFSIDPIQIGLIFMLLGMYLFINGRTILSSISLALGALTIFIPAIVIVPIILYYLKNDKYNGFHIIKYIAVFLFTIIIACLPFLLLCPETFVSSILNSVNEPHSANYLLWEDFFLTPLLLEPLITFQIFGATFSIKVLNILEISFLLVTIYFLYKKLQFKDERDLILSTIILISVITISTFYVHYRFIYWIFMLSIIILFNSKDHYNIKSLIIMGIGFFATSMLGIIFTLIITSLAISIYFSIGAIVLFILTLGFLFLGMVLLKDDDVQLNNLQINVIYSTIFIMCYFFYSVILQLFFFEMPVLIFNIMFFILFCTEITFLLFFIKKPLYKAYRRGKIQSLRNKLEVDNSNS